METPNRVREHRLRRQWTLERLGREAGLTTAGVRHIEAGVRRGTLESRFAIADALGLEYSECFPVVQERNYYRSKRATAQETAA
jgi:transcriptional regulator with XRE-family HTH domain